jgi:hypothetical protein
VTKLERKEIVILIFCLLLGFLLRFYTFDHKSLWIDEIHTYNESRDNLEGQIKYYKQNPTSLHPPFFFILTHLFYPFNKPERDLRIIPLIFGTVSILMIYYLAKSFSPGIAFPCAFTLTFMTYHIYFSQDGRPYAFLMCLGMVSIFFFMKYLKTLNKRYLVLVAFFFAVLFHTSYSSVLFIALSQILWFYNAREKQRRFDPYSFLILNGTVLILCLPWILFLLSNYKGQPFMDPLTIQDIGSFPNVVYGVLNDWVPYIPLTSVSLALLVLFPFFSKEKINSLILLSLFILPIGGLYLYCKLFNITQFITSRYFINFIPLFFITLYLSLDVIGLRFERLNRIIRPKFLFLILFIGSNLITLPLYYQAEKQDFRGLVNYLNTELRDGDRIIVGTFTYIPGILHYFKVYPENRHYSIPYSWKIPGKEFEFKVSLISQGRHFEIYHSNIPYHRYIADGRRLWIIVGKEAAKTFDQSNSATLMGHFDGRFSLFRRFPSDASMYLFRWDPAFSDSKNLIKRIK